MRTSRITGLIALVALLAILPRPVVAVEILELHSSLVHVASNHNSHSPCVSITWNHLPAAGNTFDLQAESGVGYCEVSHWNGHCDASGFFWSGELASDPTAFPYLWYMEIRSQINVLIAVTTPTRISASRSATGIFPATGHTVTITAEGGSPEVLLGDNQEIDSAEQVFGPGVYSIHFSAIAVSRDDPPFAYTGYVAVNWDSPVGDELQAWGRIKSLYR